MAYTLSFEELLKKPGQVSLHHKNLQQLAVEIYKALNNLSYTLMSELYIIKKRDNKTFDKKLHFPQPARALPINRISHLARSGNLFQMN